MPVSRAHLWATIRSKARSRGLDSAYRLTRIAPGALQQAALPRMAIALTSNDGTPEERLVLAVLLDAVGILACLRGEGLRRPIRVVQAARDWVLSDDTSWPYSFRNVCDVLDIDPIRLRRRLTLH